MSRIEFRGRMVQSDWPEKLASAQLLEAVTRGTAKYPRVKFGEESEDWGASKGPCRDCAAISGEFHAIGCDVERCITCGGQLWMGCECECELEI